MVMINIKRTLSLLIVGIISTIGLTGCFKAEISVDVQPNGSGIVSAAIGMTQQAKAFASSNGTDFTQEMQKSLAETDNSTQDVKLTSWIDGEYEWVRAEKGVANLEQINNIFNTNGQFKYFSLTRNRGLLRDEFVLEAELSPLQSTGAESSLIDPATVIQMSFSARLPGKIVETNGLRDVQDPNRMTWNVASAQAVPIAARSLTWNWVTIFVISGLCVVFGVVIVGSAGYLLYRSSRQRKIRNENRPITT